MTRSFLLPIPHVLNANDIGRRVVAPKTGPCLYFPPMDESALSPARNACPHPLVRAPRVATIGTRPAARLHPAPPGLQGAIAVILSRDARECQLSDEQRLTHFPASPVMSLSWFSGQWVGTVETEGSGWCWRPYGASLVIAGSRSEPTVTWSPTNGYGGMICFTPDIARTLFGLDPAAVHDRFVPAHDALGDHWRSFLDALESAADDTVVLSAIAEHVGPRWRSIEGRTAAQPTLRELGRHWVQRLALQSREWQRGLSARQAERRIKAFSGRSLRDWQSLVRTEGVFFAARDRFEAGLPFDWAGIAQDEGFADQAHLSRAVRRITGFPPSAQRFVEDESFWVYRLWV